MPSSRSSRDENAEGSTLRFLVTTDNHLGYAERDPRRGDDSFTTFEEVLRVGRLQYDVDAMLIGGDLFHDSKPSLGCLVRTCSLLRKYVFGDKAVSVELLSDAATHFPSHAIPLANFQDPNVNIALPIFAIHGNHDDPVGGTSALDVLAASSCINYFGHTANVEEIRVAPVLLRKGNTYVALYGLGHVRDDRLLRCFKLKKVTFEPPPSLEGEGESGSGNSSWFRMLMLHQNRSSRPTAGGGGGSGANSSGPSLLEQYLKGWGFDLVIWGNEHMQRMSPQAVCDYDIIQPGSTIQTSLSPSHAHPPPKQCGVLEIRHTLYRLTPVTLRSVRPSVSRVVEMASEFPLCRTVEAVEDALRSVIRSMVVEAEEQQVTQIPDDILQFHPQLKLPLIALGVDGHDSGGNPFPEPSYYRLGQEYMEVMANPQDAVRPVKHHSHVGAVTATAASRGGGGPFAGLDGVAADGSSATPLLPLPHVSPNDIRRKIAEVFNANAKGACSLLSEVEVTAAVYAFAEKGERCAIDERVVELLSGAQKAAYRRLTGKNRGGGGGDEDSSSVLDSAAICEVVGQYKTEMNRRYAEVHQKEAQEAERVVGRRTAAAARDGCTEVEDHDGEEEEDDAMQEREAVASFDLQRRDGASTGLAHQAASVNDPLLSTMMSRSSRLDGPYATMTLQPPVKTEDGGDEEAAQTLQLPGGTRSKEQKASAVKDEEDSDTDSFDQLLLASRRMAPADDLAALAVLQDNEGGMMKQPTLPLHAPGRRPRSAAVVDVDDVEEEDNVDDDGMSLQGKTAANKRRRVSAKTKGGASQATDGPTTTRKKRSPVKRGGGGTRRAAAPSASAAPATSTNASLPVYVPGSKPTGYDFLAAWASQ